MIDPFWLALAAKMLVTAGLVVATAAAVERVGPLIGALIATLPLSAGPAYVILAMDHGPAFIAASALTSMVSAASNAAFVALYVHAAQSRPMLASVGIAVAGWIVAVLVLGSIDWTWWSLLPFSLLGYAGTLWLIRPYLAVTVAQRPASRWFDPVVRGVMVMALVAAVVVAGRVLGPRAAGIAAVVPMIFTSVAIILHSRIGGPATAAVIGNGVPGMAGFVLALAALHVSATRIGSASALLLALSICVIWNLMLLGYGLRRRRRRIVRLEPDRNGEPERYKA